jgi:hypothetical protein
MIYLIVSFKLSSTLFIPFFIESLPLEFLRPK